MASLKKKIKRLIPKFLWLRIDVFRHRLRHWELDLLLRFFSWSGFGLFGYRCLKIEFLDQIQGGYEVEADFLARLSAPNYVDRVGDKLALLLPKIKLYSFHKVQFSIDSSNLIVDDRLIVERLTHIDSYLANYSSGFLKSHNHECGLVKIGDLESMMSIDSAYFLGGNGCSNYYHWMTEVIPKIKYIATTEGFERCQNILVPQEAVKVDAFIKTLRCALNGFRFNIYAIDSGRVLLINKLWFINKPCDIVFNTKKTLARIDFSYYRKPSLDYIRDIGLKLLQTKFFPEVVEFPKRIFLARREGAARPYNQFEIQSILINEFGFQSVFLEDYEFELQIRLFSNAEMIVGPSGAAWVNIVFCNPTVHLISWLPSSVSEFSAYSTIADNFNLNMIFLPAQPDLSGQVHTGYKVCPSALRQYLTSLV